MLYDFHRTQTTKKLGSVHATYLVSGRQITKYTTNANGTSNEQHDSDRHMRSSPFMSSSMPRQDEEEHTLPASKMVTLVREEQLESRQVMWPHLIV